MRSGRPEGINLENVLIYNVAGTAIYPLQGGAQFIAQNVTVHDANLFFNCGPGGSLHLTNSILISCTNLGSSYNGTSNYINQSDAGIFQTVGAGAHYLATNCPSDIRGAGSTNIDPVLLADLQTKTTYPPLVYSNITLSTNLTLTPQAPRDPCFPGPDLGYHYDPIDHAVGGVIMTNATLTISPGTVIATFGGGLGIGSAGRLVCEGLATDLNRIVGINTVQEGSSGWPPPGDSLSDYCCSQDGTFDFRFTDWSLVGPAGAAHVNLQNSGPVNFRDCQFHGGVLFCFGPTFNLTNCLFDRVLAELWPTDGNVPVLRNNLFYGGTLDLLPFATGYAVVADNLFDRTSIVNYYPTCTYSGCNGYVTNYQRLQPANASDVILTNPPVYQTGPLGTFYQPANSPLINAGSESADAAGLTGYTILTNQTPDANKVEIGYHYKIIGNDSTGTDFWLAFFSTEGDSYTPFNLSLYISSPAATSGMLTYPVDGTNLTIMGDPSVSGIYVLTNTPPSEMNNYRLASNMYVYGNLQVVLAPNNLFWNWEICNYSNGVLQLIYYKADNPYLNGSNWIAFPGIEQGVVMTSCPQVPFSQSFSVAAGTVTNLPLPLNAMLDEYDANESKGIHITASQPVSVYGFSYYIYLSSAFTAYPTPMLGTNYCIISRTSALACECTPTSYYSQFAIVGTANSTTVCITPSATADFSNGQTNTYSIELNQGDTYLINSSDWYGDMTGTRVVSDEPIAVFAGNNRADIPDGRTQAENPLIQEQMPVEQWGTNVVAMSFAGRLGDTFRVLAAYSNTLVTISGIVVTNSNGSYGGTNYAVITTNLNAGSNYETILIGPVQFQSTKPIQVAQFGNGQDFDSSDGVLYGDPCEILLSPTGHWMNSYIMYTSTNDYLTADFDENFLNLIVAQSAISGTLLDGSPVAATNFVAIGTSGYYGAQIVITNSGSHTVTSSQPIDVAVYGFGTWDAYSYVGGLAK